MTFLFLETHFSRYGFAFVLILSGGAAFARLTISIKSQPVFEIGLVISGLISYLAAPMLTGKDKEKEGNADHT